MRLFIRGHQLPGLECGSYTNIHVGLQVHSEPVEWVAADAAEAKWVVEVRRHDGDFRGPAVQGKRGERFVYLTWGTVDSESFSMFRRAKLMLDDLPPDSDEVIVDVDLTDECGMPRCGRLRPPAIRIAGPPAIPQTPKPCVESPACAQPDSRAGLSGRQPLDTGTGSPPHDRPGPSGASGEVGRSSTSVLTPSGWLMRR